MKRKNGVCWILGYLAVDGICVGMGMGVPFFNIMLGFPLGWFLAHTFADERKVFSYAFFAAVCTFFMMAIIWSSSAWSYMSDPTKNIANFGEPKILFDPAVSFWGWLVLMVIISPFLQLLTTIFAVYVSLITNRHRKSPLK